MEFPKMLYRADRQFEDQEALKMATQTGTLKTMIVESVDEQKVALKKGWIEDLASLVKAEPKAESEAK
ncbi:hypothetical protein AB1286_29920 [Trinickia sp. NRRL B-1857]|uniref:hypothetical protein n=1 Tax=Trinickia sp. NRRL B-1857 TaxID=3162879 RepID=UPI003D2A38A8